MHGQRQKIIFRCSLVACLALLQNKDTLADATCVSAPNRPRSSASQATPPHRSPPLASRPQDEVWLVNCRGVADWGGAPNLRQVMYERHRNDQGWTPSNQQAFLAAGSRGSAVTVFVPGDGYSHSQARTLGIKAYQRTIAGRAPELAVRFVIWSWPSDQVARRRVRDIRIKAARTPWVAWCLAHWLDTVAPDSPISVVGTGLGARIVGETLHLRGGGRLDRYQLAAGKPRRPVRAVLISAAIDHDSLLPGRRLDRALPSIERLLVVTNSTDPVLRRYHWLYGLRSRAVALGYTGMPSGGRGTGLASKIEQIDAASLVGPNHGFMHFFSAPQVVARIQPFALESTPRLSRDPRTTAR